MNYKREVKKKDAEKWFLKNQTLPMKKLFNSKIIEGLEKHLKSKHSGR